MVDTFYYFLFWICILGLCFGSFFNVVILRSLSGESIVFPPSKCPKCGNKLLFWHNIPVLSYILLRGKCYFCKEKISIQYPLVELAAMLLFAFAFVKFGISITTLFAMFWVSCLIIMTGTDLKEQLVDCNIAIIMGISGIIFNIINAGAMGIAHSLTGILIGGLILELIARAGYLFTDSRAMGEADTYVAGALGAIFGQDIIVVLLLGLLTSMVFILPVFFYKQFKNNNKLTCILGVIFGLAFVIFQTWQNYYTLAIFAIIGLTLAFSILKNLNHIEERNYLPYVPALAIGALIFLFFII